MPRVPASTGGFTLIEMIAVISITGILALVIWRNIAAPMQGFDDIQRRAELVNIAETAASRITRELRLALPNSIRVSVDGLAVEMLRTRSGGRYRAVLDPGGPSDPLDFTASADAFDVLGSLPDAGAIMGGAGGLGDCLAGDADCLAVFNTGQPADCTLLPAPTRSNAYCGDNLAGIVSASAAAVQFSRADAGTALPFQSPAQRFYIVDTPVSFICDPVTQVLRRYSDYPINAVQPLPPAGTSALLASRIGGCQFRYDPGTATRGGLATISLTVSAQGESVTLFDQVHVPNAP